jgi:LPXTG-site transpeptidase (sortase) family protein
MPNIARRILLIIVIIISSLNEKPIMNINIEKINVNQNIYSKDSYENKIDKHVFITDASGFPDDDEPVIIGAHSGIGPLAYFKDLNLLDINDLITLTYKGKEYKYIVVNKYKDDKNGKIRIDSNNDLILFTCYPNDKNNYLVIVSSLQV